MVRNKLKEVLTLGHTYDSINTLKQRYPAAQCEADAMQAQQTKSRHDVRAQLRITNLSWHISTESGLDGDEAELLRKEVQKTYRNHQQEGLGDNYALEATACDYTESIAKCEQLLKAIALKCPTYFPSYLRWKWANRNYCP